jgi:microcystin-dependent protein
MAITYPDSSTLTYLTGADSFRTWMNTTNNLIYTLSANTVTVGGNAIGTFTIGNATSTATSLLICDKVFANLSVFNVSSLASFGANVTVNALASEFRVSSSGNTVLQSSTSTVINSPSLLITSNATLQGITTLSGNVEFNGTNKQILIAGGTPAGVLSGLKVTSDAEFANAYFTKASFGELTLSGALVLPSLSVTGAETVGTTLTVAGATTLNSTLSVSAATTLSSTLGVTGAANTLSTLGVSGAANVMNALGVSGKILILSNNSIGAADYALEVQTGNTYFGGRVSVAGIVNAGSALNVSGIATVSNTLVVSGNTTFSANITGNGAQLASLNASAIASGTVPTARLGSGTANSITFLAGDQQYRIAGIPVGVIVMTAATTASTGYLLCAGQAVSRSTYADLFAVTSTRYGVGDNSTTFNIPNLTQRFPIGANTTVGNTTFATGNTGGAFDHTHSGPSHRHTISSDGSHSHTLGSGLRQVDNNGDGSTQGVIDGLDANTSANGAHTHGGFTGYEGTGNTGSANPPYVVVNFQIKF